MKFHNMKIGENDMLSRRLLQGESRLSEIIRVHIEDRGHIFR